ncbi:hypothetical protein [Gandjariella thermophila]|uniref:Uncharacterized protein n=1 Tax=Gandjariella thermophila TaxID=1931992 RepID=A0A4D4JGR9_9PSEU|nr:hypothetical protein [Gandjariella thermophila]GDY33093.1 hypothetical protein GTS_47260 [Gandjariella thermophila]
MIQSLTSFTVTAHYGRDDTTFDVRSGDGSGPVARAHKASAFDSRAPYQVLVGPQLDQPAGFVNAFGAWTTERTKIGTVTSERRLLGRKRWQVNQHDLPSLTGEPIGASAVRYRFPFSLVLTNTAADNVLPFKLTFIAPGSDGFVVARSAGVRARFTVTVRDPRLDRRVLLACVIALSLYESADLRQQVADFTANPFKE